MNKKNIFINVCLAVIFLASCEMNENNNGNSSDSEPVTELFDNSVPVSRYLEKRRNDSNTGYLPVESWKYNSKGELSEYCLYNCENPNEIKVTIYDNDTADKKQIGTQILKYGENSLTHERELLEKKIFNNNGELQYISAKKVNGDEISYIEKKNGEVCESKKRIYNEGMLIKESTYANEAQTDYEKDVFYEYNAGKVSAAITRNYYDIDNDEADDVVKTYYTKYSYGTDGMCSREETFLLKEEANNITSGSNVSEESIADLCEVKEYEYEDGHIAKIHTISDGKDQNYIVYSYAKYKDCIYESNIYFYNNAEIDNQLIERQEYRYYDDNDSADYFYEESFFNDSADVSYDENGDYTYVSRSENKIPEGCRAKGYKPYGLISGDLPAVGRRWN